MNDKKDEIENMNSTKPSSDKPTNKDAVSENSLHANTENLAENNNKVDETKQNQSTTTSTQSDTAPLSKKDLQDAILMNGLKKSDVHELLGDNPTAKTNYSDVEESVQANDMRSENSNASELDDKTILVGNAQEIKSAHESTPTNSAKPEKKPKKKRYIMKKIALAFLCLMVVAIVALIVYIGITVRTGPVLSLDRLNAASSTLIFDKDNNQIAEIGEQKRQNITYSEINHQTIDAFLALEDSRFYEHGGVDVIRILSSARTLFRNSGASTITQQYVKNSFFVSKEQGIAERSVDRKIREMYLSLQLEKVQSKEDIITGYINKVNYGGPSGNPQYGLKNASRYYFNKRTTELSINESVILSSIPNAPSFFNPYNNLSNLNERKNLALDLAVRHDIIAPEEAILGKQVNAKNLLGGENVIANNLSSQPFIELAAAEVLRKTGYDPYTVPMRIYTSLDQNIQNIANDITNGNTFTFPHEDMETGFTILDNDTGKIVAIGAGRNYSTGGYNLASDMRRQIGSSAKPILDYLPAFEYLKWSNVHTLDDRKMTYSSGMQINNADRNYMGKIPLNVAVGFSRNTTAVYTFQQVLKEIGYEGYSAYFSRLGLNIPPDQIFESTAIGTSELSPIELAAAYSVIANEGKYNEPSTLNKVIINDTSEEFLFESKNSYAVSPEAAYMMADVLYTTLNGPYYMGASVPGYGIPAYGKTGTSDWGSEGLQFGIPQGAAKDSWVAGFTSEYTLAVWSGYIDATKGQYISSSAEHTTSQRIFRTLVEQISKEPVLISRPSGIIPGSYVKGTFPYRASGPGTILTGLFFSSNAPSGSFEINLPTASLESFTPTLNAVNLRIAQPDLPDDSPLDTTKIVYHVEVYRDGALITSGSSENREFNFTTTNLKNYAWTFRIFYVVDGATSPAYDHSLAKQAADPVTPPPTTPPTTTP